VSDLPEPRIGDRERDVAVARLQRAIAEGRLTPEEFDERVDLALASKTRGDLDRLLADLPQTAMPLPVAGPPRTGRLRRWLVAVMGADEEKGRWRPPRQTNAIAVMGGVEMDLRHAVIEHPVMTMTAVAVMGGIDITVPPGLAVEMTGFAFMGGRSNRAAHVTDPGAPLIRLRAFALMGGVDVKVEQPEAGLPPASWGGAEELPGEPHRPMGRG
jgi:hypothetical protein